MSTIRHILERKGYDVWSIDPDATVYDALELMADKGVGAVIVVEHKLPIGVLSERDYARKVILADRSSHDTLVRDIMTPDPICITPDIAVDDAMRIMTAERIRHLPVVDDGALVGVASIGDVVQAKLREQAFHIRQLESYIAT